MRASPHVGVYALCFPLYWGPVNLCLRVSAIRYFAGTLRKLGRLYRRPWLQTAAVKIDVRAVRLMS